MTTCFPLAFGVPAILMLVAVLIFVSGYKRYKMVPPSGNRLVTMMAVIQCGLKSRLKKRGIMRFFGTSGYRSIFGSSTLESNNQIHWLDEAIPVYGDQLVQEIKIVLGILYMFLPLPFFWTLYDQQSSRWVAQAQLMNRNVTVWNIFSNTPLFSFIIKPEQMQVRINDNIRLPMRS